MKEQAPSERTELDDITGWRGMIGRPSMTSLTAYRCVQ
jgi:hypothetical protein